MQPLINIQTIPLKYEMSITPSRIQRNSKVSQLQIEHTPGSLTIQARPARLQINSQEARNSVCPSLSLSIRQNVAKGEECAGQSVQKSAKEGTMMANATPSQNILKTIIDSRVSFPIGDFNLDFIPKTGPDIQYQEPSLDIQYQMDRMNFDVRVSGGDIEYIPGSVDFTITQWPDVLIEYIGQPMYVPPRDDQFSARA